MFYAKNVDSGRIVAFDDRRSRDVYCLGGYSVKVSSKEARQAMADAVYVPIVKQYGVFVKMAKKDVYNMPIGLLVMRYYRQWDVEHGYDV